MPQGAVTDAEIMQAKLRVKAIESHHVANVYPGTGFAAQVTNAVQLALAPFQQTLQSLVQQQAAMQQSLQNVVQQQAAMQQSLQNVVQQQAAMQQQQAAMQQQQQQDMQIVQQGLQQMQDRAELAEMRALARMQNSLAIADSTHVHALPLDVHNNVPDDFPATRGQLRTMLAPAVDALLAAYNRPATGDHDARRQGLALFLGVPL